MELRDKLNSKEGYHEIIDLNRDYIKEINEKIQSLHEDEKNGIQKYPKSNLDVIKSSKDTLLGYQYEVLVCLYSMGESIENVKQQYIETIKSMHFVWRQSNGYVEMVWMLSIGIMLDIEEVEFLKLVDLVKRDNPGDFLIDFLIKSRIQSWEQHQDFKFPNPYKTTKEIVDLAQHDRNSAVEKLKFYLQKEWYRGHSDMGWYNDHKSKWNIHTGYWSFESGALVKILGLDDPTLKNQQYYPYDLVHWKS